MQAIQQIRNGEVIMNNTSRPLDEAVVELLREDPTFADEYLAAAMEQANQDGGYEALLAALCHVAEAQV
jgi:DNA-binding phage protein